MLPISGQLVTASVLNPPLPLQPVPRVTATGAHDDRTSARRLLLAPPVFRNSPPTTRSPSLPWASSCTVASAPVPKADQLVPFQRAMRLAGTPPALVNRPPAIRSPLASTRSDVTALFMPEPSADQLEPFQRAMRLAAAPPAVTNVPPTTTSPLGRIASASPPSFLSSP